MTLNKAIYREVAQDYDRKIWLFVSRDFHIYVYVYRNPWYFVLSCNFRSVENR